MKQIIIDLVAKSLKNLYGIEKEILVDIPKDESADYSVNTALQSARDIGKNPKEIAEALVQEILQQAPKNTFEKVEIAGAGFIYFTLSKESLLSLLKIDTGNWGNGASYESKNIMVEFAHPNTHKAFHIGHLRNICLGESMLRLIDSQTAKTFRANYQGDIGLHVAKCLWALQTPEYKSQISAISQASPTEKAEFLGKVYAVGGKAYEADEQAKKEIQIINKALYTGADDELKKIYEESRTWSLEYFESIYKRLGTRPFDGYFFESQTWEPGKKTVEENIGKVFTKSNGAIVFEGENYGLHTRVFISSEGNPTYEAKEIGLAPMEYEAFPFDTNIHVVANEQAEYFKVVFEAMDKLWPGMKAKQKHLSYGMVKLTSGKMSSRTGDVITAEWLLNEAKTAIFEILKDRDLSETEKEQIAEQVAVGAIKFTMLHTQAKNDIAFDLEKAVRLDGDSGPYIQYAHARISSILRKAEKQSEADFSLFNEDDWKLLRKIQYFPYQVARSSLELSPHHISHYLLHLTADFSAWYAKNSVLNAEAPLQSARIELIKLLQTTLQRGLYFMGIGAPEKM